MLYLLKQHGSWKHERSGWNFTSALRTRRLLEQLLERGLVICDGDILKPAPPALVTVEPALEPAEQMTRERGEAFGPPTPDVRGMPVVAVTDYRYFGDKPYYINADGIAALHAMVLYARIALAEMNEPQPTAVERFTWSKSRHDREYEWEERAGRPYALHAVTLRTGP